MVTLFIRDMLALLRVTVRRLSILVILSAVVVVAVWFTARYEVVDWLVRRGLYETPTPMATYEVIEVRTDRIVLGSVAIDGLLWADQVEIGYSPRQAIDGRVGSITIRGAVLQITVNGAGNPTGAASDWVAMLEQSESSGMSPPFDAVVLEHGTVDLTAPWGHVRADINGALKSSLAALEGAGTWFASSSYGAAEGSFSLHAPHGDGSPDFTVALMTGDLGYQETLARGVSGTIRLELEETPRITADFRASSFTTRDHAVEPLTLNVALDRNGLIGQLTLGDEDSAMAAFADVSLDISAPESSVGVTGWLDLREDFTVPGPDNLIVAAPARLDLSLNTTALAMTEVPSTQGILETLAFSGSVAISADGIIAPDTASAGAIDLAFGVNMTEGELLAVLNGSGHVRDIRLAAGDGETEFLPADFDQGHDLVFADRGLRFSLGPTDEGWLISPRAVADLIGNESLQGSLSLGGTASLDESWNLLRTSVSTLEADLQGTLWPGLADGSLRVAGQGSGTGQDFEGSFNLQARLDTLHLSGAVATDVEIDLPSTVSLVDGVLSGAVHPIALVRAETLSWNDTRMVGLLAEWPLRYSYSASAFHVYLTDTGWIDIESLRHPAFKLDEAMSIKFEPEHLPNVVIERPGRDISWDIRLTLAPSDVAITLLEQSVGQEVSVTGQLPKMGIRFGSLGVSHLQGTMETSLGDLRLLGPDLRVADIKLLVNYNDGLSVWPQISAEVRRFEDLRTPARFAPIVADANIAPVWPLGDDLRITGNLHMQDRRYFTNVEASYEPSSDRFMALIRTPPVIFERGGAQPTDVSPLYGALLEDAEGSLEILGKLGYENGEPTSDITLFIRDLSGRSGDVTLSGLNGEITLSELAPWATPPNQTLTAESIDLGIPLTDIELALSLPGDDSLYLELGKADIAGGSVSVGPSVLRLGPDQNRMDLDVRGVDLSQLLAYAEIPDLEIDARLSGSLPMVITGGDLAIVNGHLESEEAGTLRYLPSGSDVPLDLGEDNVDLVLDALSNFHFSRIAMDVNKPVGGTTELTLHVAGANPDLYDGYPIELNVNVTGDLDKIVRDSLAGWRISEELKERLSGF